MTENDSRCTVFHGPSENLARMNARRAATSCGDDFIINEFPLPIQKQTVEMLSLQLRHRLQVMEHILRAAKNRSFALSEKTPPDFKKSDDLTGNG